MPLMVHFFTATVMSQMTCTWGGWAVRGGLCLSLGHRDYVYCSYWHSLVVCDLE